MNYRAEYLLEVLEKIGSPLMVSIIDVNARAQENAQALTFNEAQKMAELLAKAVQAGIDISNALDLGPTGQVTDSIRVAATGLASPLIAASFRNSGKSPGDTDIQKITGALQAVLTFSENFSANDENTTRLKENEATGKAADPVQSNLQYLQAMIPVVNAIATFAFGQSEQKLIMDVALRLTQEAAKACAETMESAGKGNKAAELAYLKGLALLYTACHEAEVARIWAMSDDERAGLPNDGTQQLETLWRNFEMRAAMLKALAQGMTGNQVSSSAASGESVQPKPAQKEEASPTQASSPAQTASPLSMFAKKPLDTAAAPSSAQTTPNPMSFFKGPPKQADQQ